VATAVTPVLQIGADVYCDTSLICNVLDQLQPEPSLYGKHPKGLVRTVAQWADNIVFPAAMGYNFQPAGAAHVFASLDPEVVKVFPEDRQAMRGGAARMPAGDATSAYKNYLRRVSSMLEGQDFVLGSSAHFGRLFHLPLCVVHGNQSAFAGRHFGRYPLGESMGYANASFRPRQQHRTQCGRCTQDRP
jgi:glutathione S-transferase